jgi:CheY-like chemotaxis protein
MEVIGQLAAGVAHDFNNILAVILGHIGFLVEKMGPAVDQRQHVEEIQHAAERAVGLTRQLLIFSRNETVEAVVLEFDDAVRDMEKMLSRLISEDIELTILPGAKNGRIKADSGYIGQVLMNLVVNARDAMPSGGKLTISTSNVSLDAAHTQYHPETSPGDYVMLQISDTGTGMTDEVKARLFEAFFTTKPKGAGTGLGLSTCRSIIRQSGGHIEVYSELGQGTTFKIYFPRIDQALKTKEVTRLPWPQSRSTETLLVVEDDASVRRLAQAILEAKGYHVLSACNGQDGLRVAHEHSGSPISLVVSDLIMPVMGGKVMTEWLKTTYPDIRVIFTSGYTDEVIKRNGVFESGIDFLPKPYTPKTLTAKVRDMLDTPQTTAGA